MMKRNFLRGTLAAFLAGLTACGPPPVPATQKPAPPVVLVATATAAEASTFVEAVATLQGATSREIHSPGTGYVVRQAYPDGALVRAGDLLFVIDTRPAHTITKIVSPIAGVAVHAASGVGDLINPSTTLTTVSAIDTMTADFALPVPLYHLHATSFAQLLAQPIATRPSNIRLQLEDGSIYPTLGKLSALENSPPASIPTVSASALLPNPDHLLKPGQFAKVRITIDTYAGAVLVPRGSIRDADQVMVVQPDNTVEVRHVTVGDSSGPSCIITNGIAVGERVVVENSGHVVSGATVKPQPYIEPVLKLPATNAPPQ